MKILVIGDSHVDENQKLDRFECLNKVLKSTEGITHVISIGDFLSLNALSGWDRSKRLLMENRRYSHEVEAGRDALSALQDGLDQSDIEWVYIEGNHENRATRYCEEYPEMFGTVDVPSALTLDERGWKWVPYKQNYNLNGVSFTHIPINGAGKAIGNPNVAHKALQVYANSVVFGHTHTLDIAGLHRQNAPHLNQALSVGCFFEHIDEYAKGSMTNYWRGVVLLDMYSRNRFDISTLSMRQVKAYGKR
jgi:predicted phosphodiesterase